MFVKLIVREVFVVSATIMCFVEHGTKERFISFFHFFYQRIDACIPLIPSDSFVLVSVNLVEDPISDFPCIIFNFLALRIICFCFGNCGFICDMCELCISSSLVKLSLPDILVVLLNLDGFGDCDQAEE